MLLKLNICTRIGGTLPRHKNNFKILWFGSCNHRVCVEFSGKIVTFESRIHFGGDPFAYNGVIAFFSSCSSRSDSPRLNINPNLYLKNDHCDDTGDGYFVKEELDSKECKDLSFSDTSCDENGKDCSFKETASSCRFDNVDEFEESENEDGGGSLGCIDDDFKVLDSFGKSERQMNRAENVGISERIEGVEDAMRHPLVKETCRLIERQSAWTPKLEIELRRLLRSLKPLQICAVLRSQSDERVALKFFYWADQQWRYRHDPIIYYVMLQLLSRTKLCQGAKRILKLMARRRIPRRPEDFGCVMVSFSRAGHLRKAMQILNVMQRAGIEPDLSICNTAIYVLVKGNKIEKALRFLERMQLVGINPNVVTYNCLIKGYCDVHRVEDALELIAEMPYKGCSPDKVSYYTPISFFCTQKQTDKVKELVEKMAKDSNLLPDQVTYNTIIHMLSKHGHADEALGFLREAEERGFRVDKVGYSAVVNSFCKDGRIDKAKELVNEMIAKGCNPDVVTYTAVLNGFCLAGKTDQAKKLLQHMYKYGCKPNTVSYTALLNGLCRSGRSAEAREMMSLCEESWWRPNAITFSVLMHGYRREGKLSEACDVGREMIAKGYFPTPVEINLLIRSLCQEGRADEAKNFMEECLKKGCAVNVVNFTTLIHGFCQKNELDAALSVLDDMYLINKHPDAVTYTTLIDGLAKQGRMEEAINLANKMLHRGVLPTAVTYRTVIHRFCQQRRVDDLVKLLEKMLSRQGCKTAYNQVIEKLCGFGYADEAYKLLGNVLRTASRVDANTCHILMETYLKERNPLSSYKVACRMFNRNLIPDLKLCDKVKDRLMQDGRVEEADKLMLRFVERGRNLPQLQRA
ncbi:pentatricopeptide repeat-containing protein At1g09900 [Nicotiana tomentosiformis]|uniref:pentatricopeptide repeat-containing protein At1g09900 n=1 Tax=Nicotiana tomentosiformis TaxID=4098 RepID=UPI00051C89D7|nr:pentatricopeptide repeat-containing protein At1g09900-like [Nicotiana tomentosiformis]